jgi:hypothetical protein
VLGFGNVKGVIDAVVGAFPLRLDSPIVGMEPAMSGSLLGIHTADLLKLLTSQQSEENSKYLTCSSAKGQEVAGLGELAE